MKPLIMGVETEYALKPNSQNPLSIGKLNQVLLNVCKQVFPSLAGKDTEGIFLANGARMYIDCGDHPEFATPECTTPEEVVQYLLAQDEILRILSENAPANLWTFFKSNVDYLNRKTWGAHESYLYRMDPEKLAAILIPHLITRVIYTGAGGLNPFHPGMEYTLSPRTYFFSTVMSSNSTCSRPLYHTKNESLTNGRYNRCHVIYGESLCSNLANYLKCGTTALIIALADAGLLHPSQYIKINNPLKTAKLVAADHTGGQPFTINGGEQTTALQVQQHYLALVRTYQDHPQMPSWTAQVCEHWQRVLNAFRNNSAYLKRSLDGHIKWVLFKRLLERHGITEEEDLQQCNQSALAVSRVWDELRDENELSGTLNEYINTLRGRRLLARKTGLTVKALKRLPAFMSVRYEWLALELQFCRLDSQSLFYALDRQGVLDHGIAQVDAERVREYIYNPPQTTRAKVRGENIARFHSKPYFRANWTGIYDVRRSRKLDLSNPFTYDEAYWINYED